MKCKDCKYLHFHKPINKPNGYTRAFCSHWESNIGEIKVVIRKCQHYVKNAKEGDTSELMILLTQEEYQNLALNKESKCKLREVEHDG